MDKFGYTLIEMIIKNAKKVENKLNKYNCIINEISNINYKIDMLNMFVSKAIFVGAFRKGNNWIYNFQTEIDENELTNFITNSSIILDNINDISLVSIKDSYNCCEIECSSIGLKNIKREINELKKSKENLVLYKSGIYLDLKREEILLRSLNDISKGKINDDKLVLKYYISNLTNDDVSIDDYGCEQLETYLDGYLNTKTNYSEEKCYYNDLINKADNELLKDYINSVHEENEVTISDEDNLILPIYENIIDSNNALEIKDAYNKYLLYEEISNDYVDKIVLKLRENL